MEQAKRSTFKLLFYLKKNEPKKNGKVTIMGRITIDGKPASFSAKLETDPKIWDLKHGRVSGKSTHALDINATNGLSAGEKNEKYCICTFKKSFYI